MANGVNRGLYFGIVATNIRQGGGVTHLSQLLTAAHPFAAGFEEVTVWSPQSTVDKFPIRPWLVKCSPPWMASAPARR